MMDLSAGLINPPELKFEFSARLGWNEFSRWLVGDVASRLEKDLGSKGVGGVPQCSFTSRTTTGIILEALIWCQLALLIFWIQNSITRIGAHMFYLLYYGVFSTVYVVKAFDTLDIIHNKGSFQNIIISAVSSCLMHTTSHPDSIG